jgi:hypothetical protein
MELRGGLLPPIDIEPIRPPTGVAAGLDAPNAARLSWALARFQTFQVSAALAL